MPAEKFKSIQLPETYKKRLDRAPNLGGGPSLLLLHTLDICTVVPQKPWVQHWLKFISGNYNVFKAMFSFIKNPSSGLKFKHESISFVKTTLATKIMWIVFSPNCNMYIMTPLQKPCLHTFTTVKSSFGLPVA